MITYPKIETLYTRFAEKGPRNFKVDEDTLRREEFGMIKDWTVQEKIDGTNIRIGLDEDGKRQIGGRTDRAQLPGNLLQKLDELFPVEMIKEQFPQCYGNLTMFGEGYGAGIQKGGGLYGDVNFILFDVHIEGWWLKMEDVRGIAEGFDIQTPKVYAEHAELAEIVDKVKNGFNSDLAEQVGNEKVAEGVICRTEPYLLFRDGKRLMFKLKETDF